jgi:hypothetical protein
MQMLRSVNMLRSERISPSVGDRGVRPGAVVSRWDVRPAVLLAAVVLSAVGCGRTPPAAYRLNMVEAAKQRLTTEQQRQVATVLAAMFGTPDEPVALPETGLDEAKLRLAAGPVLGVQVLQERHAPHAPSPRAQAFRNQRRHGRILTGQIRADLPQRHVKAQADFIVRVHDTTLPTEPTSPRRIVITP